NSEATNLKKRYYEYLCLLGKGEYGQVFKVMDRRNSQVSAVKVIDLEFFNDNEIKFMQDINHRNITNLIEVYYWEKRLYVIMELCVGGSLFGLCYKTGPLTEQEIAYITKQCLQGLHNMHGKGYMHRDLKLENILLTKAGEVKICDFGLVEKMENKTAVIVGTEITRAPEVSMAEERGSYDERCDIWSLGISVLDLAEYMSLLTYESDKSFVRAALTVDPARRPTAEELLNHSFILNMQSRQRRLRRRVFSIQEHHKKHISRDTETVMEAQKNRPEKLHISRETETVKVAKQRHPENQNIMQETETAKEFQPNSPEKGKKRTNLHEK
uniref:non-specific serine/threonine protein kinase n=1 Tax=Denticeps clupeoides TaxID=299321 RepID=A0AAY4DNY8_9TELE